MARKKVPGCWKCKTMTHMCRECNFVIDHPADNEMDLCTDCLPALEDQE